jgi:hypothetical protein
MFSWRPRVAAELRPRREAEPGERRAEKRPLLSKDALMWLLDLMERPFMQTTLRDRLLSYSGWRAKKVRDELEGLGYVKRHEIATGRRGGQLALEEITEEGYALLAEIQVAVKRPRGKGGYVHKFWQHKVAEWARQNYEGARVRIEDDPGAHKSVDVAVYLARPVEGDERAVAFEVLVEGEGKELSNVAKDMEAGFDEVVICVERMEIAERLRGKVRDLLGPEISRRVKFHLLAQFLAP